MIETDNICKSFHGTKVLDHISITVSPGLNILVGRSGSGKTTLLNILSGLLTADSGTVRYDGTSVIDEKFRARNMGFVFQSISLIPCLNAKENVMLGTKLAGRTPENIPELFKRFQLSGKESRFPHELSGGEKQRVAMMRATVHHPKILFADEPTAQLDSSTAQNTVAYLRELLNRDPQFTVIMTTHDAGLLKNADRIFTLSDGRIQETL